jgi:phospho-N-acetylmuramoyl-pentapeptide-transferase
MLGEILIAGMAAMLICIFLGPRFIEYLRLKEFGQHIREEGPTGAPREGGHAHDGRADRLHGDRDPYLVLSDRDTQSLAVFGVALGCAAIGFADDFLKIVRRRSLGLSARYKLLFQAALALGLWYVAKHSDRPRLEPRTAHLGCLLDIPDAIYPVVIFLVIAGSSNAVNLTDGVDGLAAGCCAIVLLAYTASPSSPAANMTSRCSRPRSSGDASASCGSTRSRVDLHGGHRVARLGRAIGALAVMTQTEILLIITGGIFVIEALSVALQVAAFKAFRRRVLLMAPVHHHFELLAWSETKIMLRFWIIAAVCAGIGFTLYQQSIGT